MTCYFCNQEIESHAPINWHHPELRSNGGTEIVPSHPDCHIQFHSRNGQFRQWGADGGKKAALTMRWAFNLLNVRNHPAYESARQFYLKNHANAGWSAGLI